MSNNKPIGGKGYKNLKEGVKTLSDADQAFIAKIQAMLNKGEGPVAISDADQARLKRLMDKKAGDTGGRTTSDKDLPLKKGGKAKMMGGGKVHMKKYAKGGGMRKAQTHG